MFYLYHHNDLDHLATLLHMLRSQRQGSPLDADTILVPNHGVGRWLTVQVARNAGVAANIDTVLMGDFTGKVVNAAGFNAPSAGNFESDRLTWHLYAMLPEMAKQIRPVAEYLGNGLDAVRRYQLAEQLARVFVQYLVYRSDVLEAWEAGETPTAGPGRWQAPVWRWITSPDRLGGDHRARLLSDMMARLPDSPQMIERVKSACPERIYCFGLVALPPQYLRVLYALAPHVDIHFMLPNPSSEYWGDIQEKRVSINMSADDAAELPGEATVAQDHSLLSSLGRMARDTLRIMYADEFSAIIEPELGSGNGYNDPGDDTLLHRLQSGIIHMDVTQATQGIDETDTSIEAHACHTPTREIQVLQDQILDRLAADDRRADNGDIAAAGKLAPQDIVVMMPNVADYASAIETVFGGADHDRYLPYTIADKSRAATHPIMETVQAVLSLPLSRWGADDLLRILAVPAVMRRFGVTDDEYERIVRWVDQSGIRWARDGGHRETFGAGRFEQNTWKFGLHRLIIGVIQSDDETLVDGVAPWSDIEGNESATLGKLWRFEKTLSDLADDLERPSTAEAWQSRLHYVIDAIFDAGRDGDTEQAINTFREIVGRLSGGRESMAPAGDDAGQQMIELPAIREFVNERMSEADESQPFVAGGITFCGMVPLRAVPFRVVAILGLNDDAFPRQDGGKSFNIMLDEPRIGDRTTRNDDRLLFLQAMTAARDGLYLSYIGQDIHSGDTRPASPIVGELLAFINATYARDMSTDALNARLIHEQPMHPFSKRYFDPNESDSRVLTYSHRWQRAVEAAAGERREASVFVDDSVAPDNRDNEPVTINALTSFFEHPARAFFRERLGLDLRDHDEPIEEDEPFECDPLMTANLRRRLMATAEHSDEDEISDRVSDLEKARGLLPPTPLAAEAYSKAVTPVNEMRQIKKFWYADGEPASVDVDVSISGTRLVGRVEGVWKNQYRQLRTSKLKTAYRLRYWIQYLALVAAGHDRSMDIAGLEPKPKSDAVSRYSAHVSQAQATGLLDDMISIYNRGQSRPLCYHPDIDDSYNEDQSKALDNVNYRFKPGARNPHYLTRDPYVLLLLGPASDPLRVKEDDNPFIQEIEAISGPMNKHLTVADGAA